MNGFLWGGGVWRLPGDGREGMGLSAGVGGTVQEAEDERAVGD